MWDILRQSLVTTPETDDLTGIADLDLVNVDGVWLLYALTRTSPGITVFQLDNSTGHAVQTDRQMLPANGGFPSTGLEILALDTSLIAAPVARSATPLNSYLLGNDGQLDTTTPILANVVQSNVLAAASFGHAGTEYLAASQFSGGAIDLFTYSQAEELTFSTSASVGGGDPVSLAIASVGARTYILTAVDGGNAIETMEVTASGALIPVSEGGLETQVGISGVSIIETVELAGRTFALVAAFGSSSITVLEVTSEGDLIPTDHVFDTLGTRFSRASEMKIVEDAGRVLIVIAGNDDGFSILQLLPEGRLILRGTVTDETDTTLENVSGIEAVLLGDMLNLYAASETEPGLTHYTANIGTAGVMLAGSPADDTLTGGGDNDVLSGADGNDTLSGGAGDDVLSDGAGQDDLTGGDGRDIFLLTQDGALDRILDFQPGADQVDLSLFSFLFSVQGLQVDTTSFGAVVTFRDDVTEVYRSGGGGLTIEDLGGAALLPLSHGFLPQPQEDPPEPPAAPFVVTSFSPVAGGSTNGEAGGRDGAGLAPAMPLKTFMAVDIGDDTLIGSDGDDTLNGGPGDDTIAGGKGDDLLIGDSGADTFIFASGVDRIVDFDPLRDRIELSDMLWNGTTLSVRQVIDTYGSFSGRTLTLDFGEDDRLTVFGVIDTASLEDQISF